MEVTYKGKTINIEPNSKPYILKRMISDGFDIMVLAITFFLLMLLFFNTNISNNYYEHRNNAKEIQDNYLISTGIGEITYVDDNLDTTGFIIHQEEGTNKEYIVKVKEGYTEEQVANYNNLLSNDVKYKDEKLASEIHKYLLGVLAGSIGEVVFFLVIPLTNKHRATCGQLLTGISVINYSCGLHARWYHILGRFAVILVESCVIYLWAGIYTFLLIPVISLVIMLCNKNNRSLREYMTKTMLIEKLSYGHETVKDEN